MEASTRKLLAAVAASALSVAVAAQAQTGSPRDWRDSHRGAQEGGQPATRQQALPQQTAPQVAAPAPAGRFARGAQDRRPVSGTPQAAPNRFDNRAYAQNQERGNYRYGGGDYRGAQDRRPFSGTAQVAPNRFDNRAYAQNQERGNYRYGGRDYRGGADYGRGGDYRGQRSFTYRGREYAAMRAPGFRYPSGWGYRSWGRGEYLPRIFISAPYFIDYDWLGLPPPPYGYRWVRYGPDALLVNIYDGRILDVIYDAFY